MKVMISNEQIEEAIDKIISDIEDRRGLKWEWARIGDDVKEEIKDAWFMIIQDVFETIDEQA